MPRKFVPALFREFKQQLLFEPRDGEKNRTGYRMLRQSPVVERVNLSCQLSAVFIQLSECNLSAILGGKVPCLLSFGGQNIAFQLSLDVRM